MDLATVTPSFVIFGAPKDCSITTLRPCGAADGAERRRGPAGCLWPALAQHVDRWRRSLSAQRLTRAAAARGAVKVQDPVRARVRGAQKSAHLRPKRHLHSVRQHVDAAKHRSACLRAEGDLLAGSEAAASQQRPGSRPSRTQGGHPGQHHAHAAACTSTLRCDSREPASRQVSRLPNRRPRSLDACCHFPLCCRPPQYLLVLGKST